MADSWNWILLLRSENKFPNYFSKCLILFCSNCNDVSSCIVLIISGQIWRKPRPTSFCSNAAFEFSSGSYKFSPNIKVNVFSAFHLLFYFILRSIPFLFKWIKISICYMHQIIYIILFVLIGNLFSCTLRNLLERYQLNF